MGRKGKILILILVLFAAAVVLAKPYLFPDKEDFAITSMPYEAYQQSIADGKPILLEFHADWCPSCVLMEPVILDLKKKYHDQVDFIIVDVDDPEGVQLLEKYNVSSIPVFFYIDQDGTMTGEDIGRKSFRQMEERILTNLLKK